MFGQNYIKISLNNSVFSIKAFPPKRKVSTPFIEAERSAFYFYKKYKSKKIVLCMSGGLDSEVMAESFLKADVPFSVSIWRYKNRLNDYDIKHAIMFCRENKIDYEIEDCNLELFYENKLHVYYGQKYLCNSPQVAVHLYFLEKLSKKVNIALFLPWQPPSFCYYRGKVVLQIMTFRYLAYYRFFYLNDICGSAYFLISQPALFYSYLKLPIVKYIINRNINTSDCDSYKIKQIIYQQGGFLSKPKKGKFTGFDKIKNFLRDKYDIEYNTAFRHPLVEMIPDHKKYNLHVVPFWKK